MIWAVKNDERIKATREQRKATCSLCDEEVIAKCGEIKIWHWSHKKDFVCDPFGEPETLWHLEWKNYFKGNEQEVIIGKHRADIKTKNGLIIEVQNSPISPEKIIDRENFYKNMIWILNGKTIADNFLIRNKKGILTFRWKNPLKSWWFANKPIYIDFSDTQIEKWKSFSEQNESGYWEYAGEIKECSEMKRDIFLIKKIYSNIPCGGYGINISKDAFIIEHGGKPKWIKMKKSMQTYQH